MKAQIKVIEVEKLVVPPMEEGGAAAIATLKNHPGFQYLLAKLAAQKAQLKDALVKTRHKSLTDVEFLQSGANWIDWLQTQLEAAVGIVNKPKERAPRDYEAEAFEEMRRRIDVVGANLSGDNA